MYFTIKSQKSWKRCISSKHLNKIFCIFQEAFPQLLVQFWPDWPSYEEAVQHSDQEPTGVRGPGLGLPVQRGGLGAGAPVHLRGPGPPPVAGGGQGHILTFISYFIHTYDAGTRTWHWGMFYEDHSSKPSTTWRGHTSLFKLTEWVEDSSSSRQNCVYFDFSPR